MRSTYMLLQEGDFVDVEVATVIRTRGRGGNATCSVTFAMSRVVRLQARVVLPEKVRCQHILANVCISD